MFVCSAPACRAPFDRALVTAGAVLLFAEGTAGISGATGLGVAPSAATAAKRAQALLLKDLDSVSAAREPQSALLEAAEGRLSQGGKVTEHASMSPSLKRALTSTVQPSHLIAAGFSPRGSPPRAPPGAFPFYPSPCLRGATRAPWILTRLQDGLVSRSMTPGSIVRTALRTISLCVRSIGG